MNLSKLFTMQKGLDEKIIKEKGLEGQDLLPQKILALQVELGECANEWRGFKFWSKNQKANTEIHSSCNGKNAEYYFCGVCHKNFTLEETHDVQHVCPKCDNALFGMKVRNPLLEEYVDCLHFILSIGLEINADEWCDDVVPAQRETIIYQFVRLFNKVGDLAKFKTKGNYEMIIDYFFGLGEMLGFTEEQIFDAYMSKNEVNHQRQQNGY